MIFIELWAKFVAWVSPILLPIVGVLLVIFVLLFSYDQVRINGFGFTLPWIGHVDIITGYKAEARNAAANYQQALKNENVLLAGIKKSNDALEALRAWRKAHDAEANKKIDPLIAQLQAQLSGRDAEIHKLRGMVGNAQFGATPEDRANSIVDQAYPAPGARP